jgi:hypothetical protein
MMFINSADVTDINLLHKEELDFVTETLISCDQIFRLATIDLWNVQKEKLKQLSAAVTLKSRMATFETIDAAPNTAAVIARATDLHAETQATNLQTNLRLANLEKTTQKQEQKVNEFAKIIVRNNNKQTNVSRNPNQNQNRQVMVDLTSESENAPEPSSVSLQQSQINQKRKQNELLSSPSFTQCKGKLKRVHWNKTELQKINSINPTGAQPSTAPSVSPFSSSTTIPASSYATSPLFASAPLPVPPPAPFAGNPLHGRNISPFLTDYTSLTNDKSHPFHKGPHITTGAHPNKIRKPRLDKHTIWQRGK